MTKFTIDVGSDQEHEDLVAEIYWDEEFVAMLTQELGYERMAIAIHPRSDGEAWEFGYDEFIEILEKARKRLGELRKRPKG